MSGDAQISARIAKTGWFRLPPRHCGRDATRGSNASKIPGSAAGRDGLILLARDDCKILHLQIWSVGAALGLSGATQIYYLMLVNRPLGLWGPSESRNVQPG
jgi:hypothetical protein